MSFKRDGDDKSALDNQRKRRVADLLFEDIQKEEVIRLSNGKFKCKMCSHQPTFDTLNMFYVHKQGKKHLYSIEYSAKQKQELNDSISKRKQERFLRDGNVKQIVEEIETGQEINNSSLGIKKPRRGYERKPILDLDIPEIYKATTSSISNDTTCGNQLSKNSFKKRPKVHETSPETVRISGNVTPGIQNNSRHSRYSDSSGSEKQTSHKILSSAKHGEESSLVSAMNVHKLVGKSNVKQVNRYYLSRKKQREETSGQRKIAGGGTLEKCSNHSKVSPTQTWEFYKDLKCKMPTDVLANKFSVGTEEYGKHDKKKKKAAQTTNTSRLGMDNNEKYLQALGSGWKKDWTRGWIKDEDVEFDSDEEPPDIK